MATLTGVSQSESDRSTATVHERANFSMTASPSFQ
jgi:hypothetical protein